METIDTTIRARYSDLLPGDIFCHGIVHWVKSDRGAVALDDGSVYGDFDDTSEIYYKGRISVKRYDDLKDGDLFNGCWIKGPSFATNIATGHTWDGLGNVLVSDAMLNVATMALQ